MTSIYALSGGNSALQNLSQLSRFNSQVRAAVGVSFPAANLLDGAGSGLSSGTAPLSLRDSSSLVTASTSAAQTIVSSLQQIQSLVTQAQAPDYNSAVGATAATSSSRVNLQTRIQALVSGIDDAVQSASVGNASLTDGRRASVTLSTTALGGQINAAVQALNSSGLGISGLDVTTDSGVQDALSRVNAALGAATSRSQNLQSLGRVFQDQAAFVNNVAASLAQSGGGLISQLSTYSALGQGQAQPSSGRGGVVNVLA